MHILCIKWRHNETRDTSDNSWSSAKILQLDYMCLIEREARWEKKIKCRSNFWNAI